MREALHDPEELPFEPGTSPFRLKEIVYRGHVEYGEEHGSAHGLPLAKIVAEVEFDAEAAARAAAR